MAVVVISPDCWLGGSHDLLSTTSRALSVIPTECKAASNDCSRSMIKQWADRWLAILEITDSGDFHDVVSVTEIMRRIGRESSEADTLIVTFVHGWNHNASDGDDNLVQFEALLAQLAQLEARDRGEKARKVIGVYIGWRGSSIGSTPLWIQRFGLAKRLPKISAILL